MTLAYNGLGSINGKAQINTTYIVATANDTTATVTGLPIGNSGGQVSSVSATVTATNQTGTNPTLTLTLQGSEDGVVFSDLKDSAGTTIATSALDISTASTTTVSAYVDTVKNPRASFPHVLRWKVVVGGTGTPGGTYTVATQTIRNAYRTALV